MAVTDLLIMEEGRNASTLLQPILPKNFKAFYHSKAMHHDYSYSVDRECRNEETCPRSIVSWTNLSGWEEQVFLREALQKYKPNYLTEVHSMTVERGQTNKTKIK